MKNKKGVPKISADLRTLGKRKDQDIKRGIAKDYLVFPPIVHTISKDDLTGDPEKLGKISFEITPNTSAKEESVANYFLKHFQQWLLGKKPPQKRVRPKHKRDKALAKDKPKKISSDGDQKVTVHRKMDDLIEKETESITDMKEFALANKRARKKYVQAKYRYLKLSRKTS